MKVQNEATFCKAYMNKKFMESTHARSLRIMSEYLEPAARLKKEKISNTIVCFGSARSCDKISADKKISEIKQKLKKDKNNKKLKNDLIAAQGVKAMVPYFEAAITLSKKLTLWSQKQKNPLCKCTISSGGGDGMMYAANKGAFEAKGKTVGLNISLPFEQHPNEFISPELAFEFHYFFMRKFWFIYPAKAIIVFPGGFGTLDEFMEVLTLIQTKKITRPLPIVLFGKKFWNSVINLKSFVKWGVICADDLDLFLFTDSINEAFTYVTSHIKKNASIRKKEL